MNDLLYIVWDVPRHLIQFGNFELRWYSLLFAAAFYVGYSIMNKIFKIEKVEQKELDSLLIYMIIGTVAGARLGHCLFYDFDYYMQHPLEILMVWKGGLASHGAAIGILLSLYIFTKKAGSKSYLWIVDRVVITVALAAFFIRIGNLMNSEIVGEPTAVPWAFIFKEIDDQPRHPTQIYEALAYLGIFTLLYKIYLSHKEKLKGGKLFGLFLIGIFTVRFFVEFLKENQSEFESEMILNMGQLLSIPLIITGVYFYARSLKIKE